MAKRKKTTKKTEEVVRHDRHVTWDDYPFTDVETVFVNAWNRLKSIEDVCAIFDDSQEVVLSRIAAINQEGVRMSTKPGPHNMQM